jgi:hypothetical protein
MSLSLIYEQYLTSNFVNSNFVFHNKISLIELYQLNLQNSGAHVFRCFYRGNKLISYTEYMHLNWLEMNRGLILPKKQQLSYRDHAGFCFSSNGITYFTLFSTKATAVFSGFSFSNLPFNREGIVRINPLLYMDTYSFFNYYFVINDVNYYPTNVLNNNVTRMVRYSSEAFRYAYTETAQIRNAFNPLLCVQREDVGNFVGQQLFEDSNQIRMRTNLINNNCFNLGDPRSLRRWIF